ncbi:MAG: hypothetical protein FJX72_11040, partial [Armatimonadetes bacterium]|nr:hypothetical protein [Armatimonadota bacterium]
MHRLLARHLAFIVAPLALLAPAALRSQSPRTMPPNIALRATITASSEHNPTYAGRLVADGIVPDPGAQDDVGRAWCVAGSRSRDGAEITFLWQETVTVGEIVYYGRTAWFAEECWRGYEVTADGQAGPVAVGELQRGHGPQRIRLPSPIQTRQLTLRFTSSYGGANPGASEIEIYSEPAPDEALRPFVELPPGTPDLVPEVPLRETPAWAEAVRNGAIGIDRLAVVQRKEINPSHVYTYHNEGFRPGGALCVYSIKTGALHRLVDAGQGQILDCDVAADGRTILFSWRKGPNEGYHIYRVGADGSGLRQLTDGPWHDYNPCHLPDGGISFLSTREPRFAYCWISPVGLLHRMEADGSRVRRLSSNLINDFTPSVMSDGRVLYSRWEYLDRPAIPIQGLWTIRPDGTQVQSYYGNRVLSPATFMEARQIPGSHKVLCTMTAHNGPARGAIGIIDVEMGNNAQEAITNLTPDVDIGHAERGDGNHVRGPYENPFPLDSERFLFSARGTVAVRDYSGTRQAVLLRPRDNMGFYAPQPLKPRRKPLVLSSALPPAGSDEWATVILQDVYRGLTPEVKRGEVTRIAVIEEMAKPVRTDAERRAFGFQFPVISCGATYAAKKVWGFVPVAQDGSARFLAPPDVPLTFLALDAQGRAVQRMRTFTHFKPGERQACVGCHDHGSRSPALMRAGARPRRLNAPSWGVRGFDYASIVQPVLDRRCVSCHSGPTPAGKVDLRGDKTDFFNASYEALARGRDHGGLVNSPYVNWIPTYNGWEQNILQIAPKAWGSPKSRLADIIVSGHPDAQGRARVRLTDDERLRVLLWIDLNVPYYGTALTAYPDNEGCRRLYPADL